MSDTRRIIRVDENGVSVAREARFESEAQLHDAIAAHPELLRFTTRCARELTLLWLACRQFQ